jgi:hypothetical protein
MHALLFVGLVGALVAVLFWAIAYFGVHGKSRSCVVCGLPSTFGYSTQAESARKDIASVCLNCLKKKLAEDYEKFEARALVVEPAPDLPCYVVQPSSKWKDQKLSEETETLLLNMKAACHRSGARANFLWVTSIGLRGDNAEMVFVQGIAETLLRWGNSSASSVCARCCVSLISQSIERQQLTFVEVCAPRSENGFVIATGY